MGAETNDLQQAVRNTLAVIQQMSEGKTFDAGNGFKIGMADDGRVGFLWSPSDLSGARVSTSMQFKELVDLFGDVVLVWPAD